MKSRRVKVAVVGAGEIGTALGGLLRRRARVVLWDKNPRRMPQRCSLEDALKDAVLVFLCVPSFAVVPALRAAREHLSSRCPLVALTKGLIPPRGDTVDEVLRRELGRRPRGILAGPMLAEELLRGKPGGAVLASQSAVPWRRLKPLLAGGKLKVVPSRDERGVALAGVLKNIFAIALGIAEALRLGANARGMLVQEALAEMVLMVRRLGGKASTVYSLAGVGDLVATGSSAFSSNCTLGRVLARGRRGVSLLDSEGARSFALFWSKVAPWREEFPLLESLAEVLVKGRPAREVWQRYFVIEGGEER